MSYTKPKILTFCLQAKSIAEDLLAEVKQISKAQPTVPEEHAVNTSPSGPKIPQKLQRAKVADAMKMVDREYVFPPVFSLLSFSIKGDMADSVFIIDLRLLKLLRRDLIG